MQDYCLYLFWHRAQWFSMFQWKHESNPSTSLQTLTEQTAAETALQSQVSVLTWQLSAFGYRSNSLCLRLCHTNMMISADKEIVQLFWEIHFLNVNQTSRLVPPSNLYWSQQTVRLVSGSLATTVHLRKSRSRKSPAHFLLIQLFTFGFYTDQINDKANKPPLLFPVSMLS